VALDSGYDPSQLATADVDADWVVRLAKNRVVRRAAGPYRGRGAPAKHGAPFKLADPTTHGTPDRTATTAHPAYGTVTVEDWTGLHRAAAPTDGFTVVRVQVARLPADLLAVWRWSLARCTVEHLFRFVKQTLGWTTPRLRHPAAADRWSWLVALAVWQVWLARSVVQDARLPWERPCPSPRLTPGRVRRAFGAFWAPRLTPPNPAESRPAASSDRGHHRPGALPSTSAPTRPLPSVTIPCPNPS